MRRHHARGEIPFRPLKFRNRNVKKKMKKRGERESRRENREKITNMSIVCPPSQMYQNNSHSCLLDVFARHVAHVPLDNSRVNHPKKLNMPICWFHYRRHPKVG
jgi:hypothetical protein